jgi:hypothetical protein
MQMKRRGFTIGAGGLLLASQARPAAAATTLSFPTWQAGEPGFSQWWKELIAAAPQLADVAEAAKGAKSFIPTLQPRSRGIT